MKEIKVSGLLLLVLSFLFIQSCNKEVITLPVVVTAEVKEIFSTSAICGGEVTNDGDAQVLARGVCWSTESNPTLADNTTSNGTDDGVFTSLIIGLKMGVTYYFRAYAINTAGTSYGETLSFTTLTVDVDGNIYKIVKIGTQVWMAENLKTARYGNGDFIGTTSPANLGTMGETTPKYQWAYSGDESNVAVYGRLYTWFVVADNRKICPENWHVPTNTEWITLTDYLINNGYGYGGSGTGIAKSMAATSGWWTSPSAGTPGNDQESNNTSGFSALPGGCRFPMSDYETIAEFRGLSEFSFWWSSDVSTSSGTWGRTMSYGNTDVGSSGRGLEKLGFSVRCVRD